ncbi:MAG TPA: GDSL-type esterase/lipase family protein [Allosphingosinicella sp.]|nr:GDSL-type esterase/lipase family protein [Allosphingosinicella sp.]
MLALLAALATAAPASCTERLCGSAVLAPVFAKLAQGAPVHILQLGDSHTAGDAITGAWRARLQARYGQGGRGVLAAGRPYAGYLTWGVTAAQSGGWRVSGLLRQTGAALGLAGFTQTARAAGETLTLAADGPEQMFDRLIVCAATGPNAGEITLRLGEAAMNWPLGAPADRPECRALDSEAPASLASIVTLDDAPVGITSMAVFRRSGGLSLSNLGTVGAQLVHFGRADDAVLQAEFAAYRPDLVVLAFGTNEGFSGTADGAEAALRTQVVRLRAMSDAPILLLGAPDAAGQGRAGQACGGGWASPALLGQIRERQRRTARALGLAYWDWAAAMGGRCAASRWVRAGLMRGDHVHFTREGGARIAALLDAAFMREARLDAAFMGEAR